MDRTDRKLTDAREALTTLFELCDSIEDFNMDYLQTQSWLLGPCMSVSPHTAPEPSSPCHGRLALCSR